MNTELEITKHIAIELVDELAKQGDSEWNYEEVHYIVMGNDFILPTPTHDVVPVMMVSNVK